MVKTIDLVSFPYFSESENLHKLNRHIKLHSDFMVHQIASATGCSHQDALGILLLLYFQKLGKLRLVVYHRSDLSTPMLVKDFADGPPKTPFINPLNETKITDYEELEYDYVFELNSELQIKFEYK